MQAVGGLAGQAAVGQLVLAQHLDAYHRKRQREEEMQSFVEGSVNRTIDSVSKRGKFSLPEGTSGAMAGRTRRFRPRRQGRRRRRAFRRRMRRVVSLWPRFKLVKFRVVTPFSVSPAGPGTTGQYLIKANSLNDPHGASGIAGETTNLPLGLDQWAALYASSVVVGSKHYVRVHNVSSTGAVVYGLTLRQANESGLLGSHSYYLEHPRTVSKLLSTDVDHSGLGMSYSAKRYWHVRKFMDAENQHATFSTTPGDPSDLAYVSFWFGDVNVTDGFTLEGFITSEYTVLLFDAKLPARSAL